MQINIDYALRQRILNEKSITSLIKAQEYIYDILSADSFTRFSISIEFRAYLAARAAIKQNIDKIT